METNYSAHRLHTDYRLTIDASSVLSLFRIQSLHIRRDLQRLINLHLHVFGMCDETGAPVEYAHGHRKNKQTPHRQQTQG